MALNVKCVLSVASRSLNRYSWHRSLKRAPGKVELALQGYVNPHQRLMLKTILTHFDFLTDQIEILDQEIAQRVSTHQEDIERLDSIPGIAKRMAEQILLKLEPMLKINFQPQQITYVHGPP